MRRVRTGTVPPVLGFIISGGALAAWAVILSFLGLTRPGFPGAPGAERAVVAISAALVALAIATGIVGGLLESAEHGDAAVLLLET